MSNRFDNLTRDLAGGLSRREALRETGRLLAWALLGALGLGTQAAAAVVVGGRRRARGGSVRARGGAKGCRELCQCPTREGQKQCLQVCKACTECFVPGCGDAFCTSVQACL